MSDAIKVQERNQEKSVAAERPFQRRTVAPLVDVLENADEVLIVADVPGVPESAIDAQVENDTLTLRTRRPAPSPDDRAPALGREYEEFDYARSFRIPAGIEAQAIRAEVKNGSLQVHLPKAAAAKARKIEVRAS